MPRARNAYSEGIDGVDTSPPSHGCEIDRICVRGIETEVSRQTRPIPPPLSPMSSSAMGARSCVAGQTTWRVGEVVGPSVELDRMGKGSRLTTLDRNGRGALVATSHADLLRS
jgi:hypothetical protein